MCSHGWSRLFVYVNLFIQLIFLFTHSLMNSLTYRLIYYFLHLCIHFTCTKCCCQVQCHLISCHEISLVIIFDFDEQFPAIFHIVIHLRKKRTSFPNLIFSFVAPDVFGVVTTGSWLRLQRVAALCITRTKDSKCKLLRGIYPLGLPRPDPTPDSCRH